MPNKGQILLPLALLGRSNASMLTFKEQQTSSNAINDPLQRLTRSLADIEELQETTPEYCVHPATWYKGLSPNVGFECDTPNSLYSNGSKCSITCSHADSRPNLNEISCSCQRKNGQLRNRCKWMPQRKFTTPQCSKPVLGMGTMKNLRNSPIVEQKVPYTPFQDIDIYTMSQAKKMEEVGVMDEKPTVKKSDSYKQYMKQEMNIKPGSPLTRSNFKLIDIWNKLQNTDGVYEIPYKFGQSFAYPDLIRDQIRGHLDFMNSELNQCIKFVEREDDSFNSGRLNIVSSGRGCWSYIGRVEWEQEISLGDGCHGRGRALHEFMHALGFLHEHQRPDRDDHVQVNFHNVKDGRKDDLMKFKSIAPGNQEYDPYSLMHYGTEAFSKNGKPTLVFKDESVLAGVNGNNGQRMRPTTLDQLAICKLYGCPQSCGQAVNVCDNGEQIYFASRKCDGFNDCSDGSDELGCQRTCCNSFTFRGETFVLAGKHGEQDYFKSILDDPNGLPQQYIYFHSDMGFWMAGKEVGSDYASAFAEFDAGTCTADIKTWNVYDYGISEWILMQSDGQCVDEGAAAKPTFQPITTPAPFEGCTTTLLSKILNNPHVEFDCDEKIRNGESCQPTCPTGTILMCDSDRAFCNQSQGKFKWQMPDGTPYTCKCKEPVCDVKKFSKQQNGFQWQCDYIDEFGKVPAGGVCKPSCDNDEKTPVMKYGIKEFRCAQNGHQAKWIHERTNVPNNVLSWPTWRKSKVQCNSCKPSRIMMWKTRSDLANGIVDCTDGHKKGSTCTLKCPTGKVLTCAGQKEQTCEQSRPQLFSLQWSNEMKCRCDFFNPQSQSQKPTYNCSLDNFPKYKALKNEIKCYGKRAAQLGKGTKCTLKNQSTCPAGTKPTGVTIRCSKGQWQSHSKKSKFGFNPDFCVPFNHKQG